MKISLKATVFLTTSCWLTCSACHYRLSSPSAISAPGTVVFVAMTTNRSQEVEFETAVNAALRQTLFESGQLGADSSAMRLESEILAVSSGPLVASAGRLPNYRLTASVELVLREGVLERKRLVVSAEEDYPAGADALYSETNRAVALQRAAETLAKEALRQLASSD